MCVTTTKGNTLNDLTLLKDVLPVGSSGAEILRYVSRLTNRSLHTHKMRTLIDTIQSLTPYPIPSQLTQTLTLNLIIPNFLPKSLNPQNRTSKEYQKVRSQPKCPRFIIKPVLIHFRTHTVSHTHAHTNIYLKPHILALACGLGTSTE